MAMKLGALIVAGAVWAGAYAAAPARDLRPDVGFAVANLRQSVQNAIGLVHIMEGKAEGLRKTTSDPAAASFLRSLNAELNQPGSGGSADSLTARLQAADAGLRRGLQDVARAPVGSCGGAKLDDWRAAQRGIDELNQAMSQLTSAVSLAQRDQARFDEAVKPFTRNRAGDEARSLSQFQNDWDEILAHIAKTLNPRAHPLQALLSRLNASRGGAVCGGPNPAPPSKSLAVRPSGASNPASFGTEALARPADQAIMPRPFSPPSGLKNFGEAYVEPSAMNGTQYRPQEGRLFGSNLNDHGGVTPNAITQGSSDDCYLLTSIGAIASANPQVIKNLIRQNQDGTYSVTFYNQTTNLPKTIQVDDQLPMQPSPGRGDSYVYADPTPADGTSQHILYPALIEKAYAKWKGSYDALDREGGKGRWAGTVMAELSGVKSQAQILAPQATIRQLADFKRNGYAITVNSDRELNATDPLYNNENPGEALIPDHAYWVERVDPVRGYVVLRNPWGWGDSHVLLTQNQLQQSMYDVEVNPLQP